MMPALDLVEPQLAAELRRLARLEPRDHLRVRLEQRDQLLARGDRVVLQDAPLGLADGLLQPGQDLLEPPGQPPRRRVVAFAPRGPRAPAGPGPRPACRSPRAGRRPPSTPRCPRRPCGGRSGATAATACGRCGPGCGTPPSARRRPRPGRPWRAAAAARRRGRRRRPGRCRWGSGCSSPPPWCRPGACGPRVTFSDRASWTTRSLSAWIVSGPMVLAQRIRVVSSGTFSR